MVALRERPVVGSTPVRTPASAKRSSRRVTARLLLRDEFDVVDAQLDGAGAGPGRC
jgi:hypothetical protein